MTTLTDDMRRYFFLVILLITNVLSVMSQELYMGLFTFCIFVVVELYFLGEAITPPLSIIAAKGFQLLFFV